MNPYPLLVGAGALIAVTITNSAPLVVAIPAAAWTGLVIWFARLVVVDRAKVLGCLERAIAALERIERRLERLEDK